MSDETEERNLPLSLVFVLSLLIMGFLCWGILAASYAGNVDGVQFSGRIRSAGQMAAQGLAMFAWVSFSYLAKAPAVLHYVFTEQLWLVFVTAAMEGLVVIGFVVAFQVDRNLNKPVKRKKGRKIATPKGLKDD